MMGPTTYNNHARTNEFVVRKKKKKRKVEEKSGRVYVVPSD